MPMMPEAPCPWCEFSAAAPARTVEAVLEAGRLLQDHLQQVHGRRVAEAFGLVEGWMKQAIAGLNGSR